MGNDLLWKQIAEEYIPDDCTNTLFEEVGDKKVIVIVEDWDCKGEINLFSGDSWLEAFQNSGYYSGLLDQDDDYYKLMMFDEDEIALIKGA